MRDRYHIVVVGGGYSGVALCAQLIRESRGPLAVTVVEGGEKLGRGIAYGTTDEQHLLNTRARQMSLLGDDPEHFVRWSEARGKRVAPDSFAPRRVYGEYLDATLRSIVATRRNVRFDALLETRVADVQRSSSGFTVSLEGGGKMQASAVVLATGHAPPSDPLARWLPHGSKRYLQDPWRHDDLARIGPADRVLIVGTGLTMVDVTLSLARRGHSGGIDALSRHGLLPREHAAASQVLPRELRDALYRELAHNDLRHSLRSLRATVAAAERRGLSWHAVMDALRPVTQRLWVGMCPADRQRFVGRLRTFWDVHRHRLSAAPSQVLDGLRARGRLVVRAGRIQRASSTAKGIAVDVERGARVQRERYDWVVNCTGSSFSRASCRGLEKQLIDRGLLLVDPLGLGYVAEPTGAVFGLQGPVRGLYVLGPACRAQCWENTAVPELRKQSEILAAELLEGFARGAGRHFPRRRRDALHDDREDAPLGQG
jgi:uncharacterized NAD(P)/FAD-binding protein YdhS